MSDGLYMILAVRESESSVKLELVSPDGDLIGHRLSSGIWERLGYSDGDSLDEDQYAKLCELSEKCEAVTRAMQLLSNSVYSAAALAMRLVASGHSKAAAEHAVQLMCRRGFIDEASQALGIAERQVTRLYRGRARVVRELTAKGYPADVARAAADAIPHGAYAEALDCALFKRTHGVPPEDRRERDRVVSSMMNAGFSASEVLRAIERLDKAGT